MFYEQDVTTESSPVRLLSPISGGSDADGGVALDTTPPAEPTPPADPSGQAPSQPAQQPGQSQFVPYERFQQVNARMRQYEAAFNQVNTRLQQLEQQRQQTNQAPTQEEQDLRVAREQLYKIDPSLKQLPQDLQALRGELGAFFQVQQGQFAKSGDQAIADFATQHGLDGEELNSYFVDMIRGNPALYQRAARGDLSIVTEHLAMLEKNFLKAAERNGSVALAQTKSRVAGLPPRPGGGAVGPSVPKLEPGKEREYRQGAHTDMRAWLAQNQG